MALREIVTVGDEVLRKRAREVVNVNDKLCVLLDDMAETMRYEGRGIGLAAPQVGILKRVFVVDVGDENGLIEFINPEIIEAEGEVIGEEGCLSVPGRSGCVVRPERITVRAMDRHGERFELKAEGILAVCICHENDHLDGVLFIDKIVEQEEEPN
ncbi:MAG: peptide deformylase [Oscillospiraceae bacterium]|jgi:peptide deformylase|nr:peptide deformylase [Clostridiales bacterium]MDD4095967.1 peptide deformylase [Oscillospiraceae bacterium]